MEEWKRSADKAMAKVFAKVTEDKPITEHWVTVLDLDSIRDNSVIFFDKTTLSEEQIWGAMKNIKATGVRAIPVDDLSQPLVKIVSREWIRLNKGD